MHTQCIGKSDPPKTNASRPGQVDESQQLHEMLEDGAIVNVASSAVSVVPKLFL